MDKSDYWRAASAERRRQLAEAVGSNVDYLRQVFLYGAKCSGEKARILARETGVGAHEFNSGCFSANDVLCFSVTDDAA